MVTSWEPAVTLGDESGDQFRPTTPNLPFLVTMATSGDDHQPLLQMTSLINGSAGRVPAPYESTPSGDGIRVYVDPPGPNDHGSWLGYLHAIVDASPEVMVNFGDSDRKRRKAQANSAIF